MDINHKNKTKFVGVYMEDEFVEDLKALADADGRSLSSFIRKALEDKVKAAKGTEPSE